MKGETVVFQYALLYIGLFSVPPRNKPCVRTAGFLDVHALQVGWHMQYYSLTCVQLSNAIAMHDNTYRLLTVSRRVTGQKLWIEDCFAAEFEA